MKKRNLCLALTAVLMASSLVGFAACTETGKTGGTADPSKEEGDVVLSFLHAGTMQPSTKKVEAAVSAYVEEKLGFGVQFKQTNVFNCTSDYQNWLITNQEIDIINVFTGSESFITDHSARELDSLLTPEIAPYLSEVLPERPETTLYGEDGNIYGVSVFPSHMLGGYSYMVRKDVLERAGLYSETPQEGRYTEGQPIGYEDLDTIFAAIREVMPTNSAGQTVYPCSAMNGQDYMTALVPYDKLGTESYPLATLMVDPETGEWGNEVVNYYKTDAYKEYVEWMGKWNAAGYVHPDAETTSENLNDMFDSERFVGVVLQTSPQLEYQWETDRIKNKEGTSLEGDLDLVMLPLSVEYSYLTNPMQSLMIPSKSKRPARAMQFIDLLYSDEYLVNLIMYGIEGEEWEFVDEERGYITEVYEGSRTNNYVIGGFWGDYDMLYAFVQYGVDAEQIIEDMERVEKESLYYEERTLSHKSPAWGFIYWADRSHNTTIRNINAQVMSRYFLTLAVGAGSKGTDGTFTGPGSTYEEFINALDNARIDSIVEDKAEQYAAWKAEQNS